jgi:hypothetical protein
MPVFSMEKFDRPWLSTATISPSISADPWVSPWSGGRITLNCRVQS